ncbi:Calretinin [Trichoplax sp. H2]|nr:Calretinin [Trichoplax sp. H2]|eukprot:RDD43054.1 Calretinin [Trichoplax sp. H2]
MSLNRRQKLLNCPFVTQFRGKTKLTSVEFMHIWRQYDQDHNGYIESQELQQFLKDLIKEGINKEVNDNDKEFKRYKNDLLEFCDSNNDGRIEMEELALVLPVEENFLRQFRRSSELSASDFMKVWHHYDADNSGYLEEDEMKGLVRDVLRRGKDSVSLTDVENYTRGALEVFDLNNDGKLDLKETQMMLPVEDNFFLQFGTKTKLSRKEFQSVFNHYDKDNNGYIEDYELEGLLKDLVQVDGKDMTVRVIERLKKDLLSLCDRNKDGRLQMDELASFFCYDRSKSLPGRK